MGEAIRPDTRHGGPTMAWETRGRHRHYYAPCKFEG
ncbi:MAG: hypothetical protein JWN86_1830, partial [Planctomycetota bacterium]|nr:hypothetical protein [Planctomycetota bacterium]